MSKAFIDGDLIVFRACSTAETTTDRKLRNGPAVRTTRMDPRAALKYFKDKVAESLRPGEEPIICLSDSMNYRRVLWPNIYKANRTGLKPVGISWFREVLRKHYTVLQEDGLEADDLMGLYCGPTDVIVSDDKDMGTIPARHRKIGVGGFEDHDVSEAQADWYHMYQTLVGDSCDGYKGLPGCGPARAKKVLGEVGSKSAKELWFAVVEAFVAGGKTEADALDMARMSRICRVGDVSSDGHLRLYHPPETVSNLPIPEPVDLRTLSELRDGPAIQPMGEE